MTSDGITVLQAQPGELTLKVAKLQGQDNLARALEARFRTIRGITQVQADAAQGVLYLRFDPDTITSWRSLWALRSAVATFFPEINPLELANLLKKHL